MTSPLAHDDRAMWITHDSLRFRTREVEPAKRPRVSLIFLFLEGQSMDPETLARRLASSAHDDADILIACAGTPSDLDALRRTARDANFYIAPAGTSEEDLRELAINQTASDIVTLLGGHPARSGFC